MDGFAAPQHGNESRDLAGARLQRLHRADAIEDGVAVGSRERRKEGGRPGICVERSGKGRRLCGGAGWTISSLPTTVRFGHFDLSKASGAHPTFGKEFCRALTIEL